MIRALWLGNLASFAVLSLTAFILVNWQSALSVVVGGVIALINFKLLENTIRRALIPPTGHTVMRQVLVKYYLRFAATALVLFILVRQGWVEPLGLLVGLSVVVLTIFGWGAVQAHKISKEAN